MWTYNKIIIYFCLIITGKLINWNQIKVMVNLIINWIGSNQIKLWI